MDHTLKLIIKAQAGDEAAKEVLVEENVGLVWSLVKRFSGRGYDLEDLFQIGSIGLLKSIDKFDHSYNVKFSTYAVPMIVGEIKRFLRDDGMIKVSRSLKEVAYKARLKKDELSKALDREPTIREIAASLEINEEDIIVALEANTEVESLSAVIHQGDGKPITLEDKIDQAPAAQNSMIDNIVLSQIIQELSAVEREIIQYRYYEDRTQTEIAEILGVSQVQISRIEKRILKKMRGMLETS